MLWEGVEGEHGGRKMLGWTGGFRVAGAESKELIGKQEETVNLLA